MKERRHRIDPAAAGLSRREMLCRCANGFGGLALSALLAESLEAAEAVGDPLAVRPPHFAPRARSVIFLFMDGGPSHVDSFDPKPRLEREHMQPIGIETPATVFNISDRLLASPFAFRRYGESGTPVSELFPHVGEVVDELTIIRSMHSDHSEHTSANYFMHTGSGFQGRPSMGSWVTYGLGSECRDLPGFVVLDSGLIPPGGMDVFGSGFLPASYQGMLFRRGEHPVADLEPRESDPAVQRAKLGLLERLNRSAVERYGRVDEMEATIANYELAFRMQAEVPELTSLDGETKATRALYGLDDPETEEFGRQCLLARRMVERGVRFVELLTPFRKGHDRWDQHTGLEAGHRANARATDKPIAALIRDLKSRGLLDETIVIWGGEFGRTPTAQLRPTLAETGRDHNPYGFTMWVAGGGFKAGAVHGATDEYGYFAVEDKVHVHDLHATVLHLLGLDHEKLTYRYSGRDMRLTDVHGRIVRDLLA